MRTTKTIEEVICDFCGDVSSDATAVQAYLGFKNMPAANWDLCSECKRPLELLHSKWETKKALTKTNASPFKPT